MEPQQTLSIFHVDSYLQYLYNMGFWLLCFVGFVYTFLCECGDFSFINVSLILFSSERDLIQLAGIIYTHQNEVYSGWFIVGFPIRTISWMIQTEIVPDMSIRILCCVDILKIDIDMSFSLGYIMKWQPHQGVSPHQRVSISGGVPYQGMSLIKGCPYQEVSPSGGVTIRSPHQKVSPPPLGGDPPSEGLPIRRSPPPSEDFPIRGCPHQRVSPSGGVPIRGCPHQGVSPSSVSPSGGVSIRGCPHQGVSPSGGVPI